MTSITRFLFNVCHAPSVRRYYVYIMASKSRVLYVGMTNNIWRRSWEHRNDQFPGFTCRYHIHRLVYYETFKYVGHAITREKEIKGWLRSKKVGLISAANPTWQDLAEEWFDGKSVRRIILPKVGTADPSLRSG